MVTVVDNPVAIEGQGTDKLSIHRMRKTAHEWMDLLEEFKVQVEVTPGSHRKTGNPVLIIEAIKPNEVIQ